MPNILHIFDVSTFVHAGHVNKRSRLETLEKVGATWKSKVTPAGGVSLIFNQLYNVVGRGDLVFCCDRLPTIKMDMYSEYKANRIHKPEIAIEKRVAEYILQECGCHVLARAGYEADDLIYSLVKKFHDKYDEIYLYLNDSDLYFLVDDKVSVKPASSKGKEVTRENFEQVAVKGGCRYNNITISKIMSGDISDNIPALPPELRKEFKERMSIEEFYPYYGDKNFVREWVARLLPDALSQVELVFPLDVDDLPDSFKVPDKQAIMNFGDAIGNRFFKNRGSVDFDVMPYTVAMQNMGMYVEEDL